MSRSAYISRVLPIRDILKRKSVLLLGPRRTGKTSLIRNELKPDLSINLLHSEEFRSYSYNPSLLREQIAAGTSLVAIDEIQKLPTLMDEVHSLIEERGVRFVLTGSSARKLRRTHTSLMGGRARRMTLHPFCYPEFKGLKRTLPTLLNFGTLPHILTQDSFENAWDELRDYSGDYLREEIQAEALVRKIEAYSRFLSVAATSNSELLNFQSIGSDAQVPGRTIREYYSLLEDTLLGKTLEPLQFKASGRKKLDRKFISTSKFYFFDTGVVNSLLGRREVNENSPEFGNLFETFIHNELLAYRDYLSKAPDTPIQFWRSPTGDEVDFVVDGSIGIEVKSSQNLSKRAFQGLQKLSELIPIRRKIVVCRERIPRETQDGIEVLPWTHFLELLWNGELF